MVIGESLIASSLSRPSRMPKKAILNTFTLTAFPASSLLEHDAGIALIKIKIMITGTHAIIYSSNAEADKEFFKNILKLTNVDVGRGWLIFALPPSELAVHPSVDSNAHELYLMCDDIQLFIEEMSKHHISCSEPQDQGWGILTQLKLPGGGLLGVYQPRHERP